jgi:DNA-binding NtrC family response regulator
MSWAGAVPTVLIVEDEAQVRVLAESILQNAGYETLSAATVAEALAIVHASQALDLIFTDITLADQPEGGLQIGQAAAQSRPGLPVVYTTGRGLTDGMVALFVNPNAFLAKPYTPEHLTVAVADLLRQRG